VSELSSTEHALLGAPHQYLTPLDRPTLAEAQEWCAHLTKILGEDDIGCEITKQYLIDAIKTLTTCELRRNRRSAC